MVRSSLLAICAFLAGAAAACGGDGAKSPNDGTPSGGSSATGGSAGAAGSSAGSEMVDPDPDPVLDSATMAELQKLVYDPAPPPADASNRVADDPDARELGQQLFFEKSLSGRLIDRDNDGSPSTLGPAGEAGHISCAGCHVPAAGFIDVRSPHGQISLAAQWTKRRTPTLLEVGSQHLFNWDGRRDTLWNQALGVMENSSEFNSGRLFVAQQIFKSFREPYEALFGPMPPLDDVERFPPLLAVEAGCDAGPVETARCRGKPGDKGEYDGMAAADQAAVTEVAVNVSKAISAYVRLLRCGPSRFDQWLAGDESALSRSEQRGAALFVGAANCQSCHSGPNLTDGKFHNVGLRPAVVAVAFTDTNDRGAGEGLALALTDPLNTKGAFSDGDRGVLPASVGADMEGAFRTPTLRCIANQPSFMHTAQLQSLTSVVQFFSRGGDPVGYPGTNELEPLNLNDREKADLVAFLRALQGAGADEHLLTPAP